MKGIIRGSKQWVLNYLDFSSSLTGLIWTIKTHMLELVCDRKLSLNKSAVGKSIAEPV